MIVPSAWRAVHAGIRCPERDVGTRMRQQRLYLWEGHVEAQRPESFDDLGASRTGEPAFEMQCPAVGRRWPRTCGTGRQRRRPCAPPVRPGIPERPLTEWPPAVSSRRSVPASFLPRPRQRSTCPLILLNPPTGRRAFPARSWTNGGSVSPAASHTVGGPDRARHPRSTAWWNRCHSASGPGRAPLR